MNLLDWIRANSKEGANLAEAEEMYERENPLMKIHTVEQALDFIKKNDTLLRALDSETSKRVESATERFKNEKLPDILKQREEELRKELHPEETPEQKRIRELEERLKQADAEKARQERQLALREKAKEISESKGLDFDVTRAERFHVYGDDAENALVDYIDYLDSFSKKAVDNAIKGTYKGKSPQTGSGEAASVNQVITDAKKAGNLDQASKAYVNNLFGQK
jgi:hypothetical protein